MIEFVHRISSGLALLTVVILFVWGWRTFSKGHPVRFGVSLSLLFIFTESLVGAALVLLAWVAQDQSIGRVISISIHLLNTFFLLASLALTAWWASRGQTGKIRSRNGTTWLMVAGLFAILILGVSGAITALGDTLFPSGSLAEGIQQDFSSTAHFLIRLRILHPSVAIATGLYVLLLSLFIGISSKVPVTKKLALATGIIFCTQLLAGLINLLLLAPVWMQILHLLLADLALILFVLLTNTVLANNQPSLPK
jgi:protoheme IX farnesyltransferase